MRRLVRETAVLPRQLVLPDVRGRGRRASRGRSPACPASSSTRRDSLRKAAVEAVEAGVGGLMLFGVPTRERKDAVGSGATDPDGILNLAIRDLRAEVGDATVLMADLCLDEFTDHGHCGVLAADGASTTTPRWRGTPRWRSRRRRPGSTWSGPSGMMDGQVAAIRTALDDAGHLDVGDPGVRREVRLGVLRAVPRGRRVGAAR